MDIPFILVDTRTGFHVASSNLKFVNGEAKSKGALAVLCNTVFLQWVYIDESAGNVALKGAPLAFVVEKPLCSNVHGDVKYFQVKGNYLCVVFARRRHDLYEHFADRITEEAFCGRAGQLKAVGFVRGCAEGVFGDVIRALFERSGVTDYAVVAEGPSGTVHVGGGVLNERCGAVTAFGRQMLLSGIHVADDLVCYVDIRGDSVYAVAALCMSVSCIEELTGDAILCSWALSLCCGSTSANQ
ncbi:hypothetical protein LSCM4_07588 [Leishmania orientalis]|uniref:Uncharacterized protein n=1 Tax=Leishmania orientalis TaxID=2249476 RepID=A0A836KRI7_9TRYP|nr:hypothetical protein LSCM4_07588 [Leishmania orientalis]